MGGNDLFSHTINDTTPSLLRPTKRSNITKRRTKPLRAFGTLDDVKPLRRKPKMQELSAEALHGYTEDPNATTPTGKVTPIPSEISFLSESPEKDKQKSIAVVV
eukprot:CAMPEP_0115039426 /NCGR_PEP_ID=MMETSP0216-20121206/44019_1 /TAXON_ID=223996 /ORGANISM="Protocruzia adherens, Strain Boccale" /LENGTH=103 /DNA_ID=CAMNT_0002420059 /DNA_START=163 /DNA_END=474 /DNA_ORIENTATION=+